MALWLIRAGKGGAHAATALEQGLAGIGWTELGDLSDVTSREQLEALYREQFPDAHAVSIGLGIGQVWAFRSRVQTGDLVGLPIPARSVIAIGKVTGGYEYRPDLPDDLRHTRRVDWVRPDVPRSAFDQDLLQSFGSLLTLAQIQRNNAEERIRAMVEGRTPPATAPQPTGADTEVPQAEQAPLNLEEYSRDQIQTHISRRFRGHDLARLVTAILNAQGYTTEMSPPGPDAGVDIIAGQGPMGFDPPRLVVQVKSSDSPLDVSPLRELQGVLSGFGAQQGLLVSWGGFRSSVHREARRLFFQIRLWDARDIIDALLADYDRLPDDLRAELPLKRIWTLVLDE